MNILDKHSKIIRACFPNAKVIELVSTTGNTVYRFSSENNRYFAKFYCSDGYKHIDNELMIYHLVGKKLSGYFKHLVCEGCEDGQTYAIFHEVQGVLLSEISESGLLTEEVCTKVSASFHVFTSTLFSVRTSGYGKLNGNLNAPYYDFLTFLRDYIKPTVETLNMESRTRQYGNLTLHVVEQYGQCLLCDVPGIVPIDNNMHNIICTPSGICFVDPGAIISGPIEMAYGEFTAHTFGTLLYDSFVQNLGLDMSTQKKIRLFAILSLANIMAFLVRHGQVNPEEMRPFGNQNSFASLMDQHVQFSFD